MTDTVQTLHKEPPLTLRKVLIAAFVATLLLMLAAPSLSVGGVTFLVDVIGITSALAQQRPVELVVLACAVAVVYWLAVPRTWRMASLLLMSLYLLWLLGASPAFMGLVVTLIWMTFAAARRPEAPLTPLPRSVEMANLIYVVFFAALITVGAVLHVSPLAFPNVRAAAIGFALFVLLAALFRLRTGAAVRMSLLVIAENITSGALLALLALPPEITPLSLGVSFLSAIAFAFALNGVASGTPRRLLAKATMLLILAAFVALKTPATQPLALLGWIGFSYMAFRLLHVLLDAGKGLYTDASRWEMLLYVLFFPALLVGPIDRLPHFLQERRADQMTFRWQMASDGLLRILVGCVKKFFISDVVFSPIALSAVHFQSRSTPLAWIALYFYAFYLYFDFSGYIDIALGTAQMLGYALPENFKSPYLKPNITAFWQSWHITLSNWLRTYVFLPFSRAMLQTRLKKRTLLVVFMAQMVTMMLVGLWHGITLNFALWGLWHGVGLFIHKVFSDRTRAWQMNWKAQHPTLNRVTTALSVVLTFHFVLFGWVFFALPDPQTALRFFTLLLGQPS